ncbi:hypothetical protein EDC65_1348 [Stella humosa]|uniref:Uncharacterized protein n=1 Tax=Stella humosa TaxID=94 RepID=A0A3N1MEH1_9PROT|nr:hypothetical protein [Stella humosa]ROP99565.1 hypothetical protein EDC65_1348 [Stella humosa]
MPETMIDLAALRRELADKPLVAHERADLAVDGGRLKTRPSAQVGKIPSPPPPP